MAKAKKVAPKKTQKTHKGKEDRGLILSGLIAVSAVILGAWYDAPLDLFTNPFVLGNLLPAAIWIILIAGLILMWEWKRLGVYLYFAGIIMYVAAAPILTMYYSYAFVSTDYSVKLTVLAALYCVAFWLLLRNKWHLFK